MKYRVESGGVKGSAAKLAAPRLLDEVRRTLRLKHYRLRTARCPNAAPCNPGQPLLAAEPSDPVVRKRLETLVGKSVAVRIASRDFPDCAALHPGYGTVETKLPNPHCRAMREKIDSDKGRAIYAHRMGLIEPVFGHIRPCGLRRITLRGQTKVDTQWKLYCIVHNVAKLKIYGKLAA